MPTIGNNQFPYPNTSDEPNIPGDLQKLALAVDTAIGGGNRFVATLSDLQKIPNTQLFNGMRATVTSDPTAVNNGEYVVSGGVWVSQTQPAWVVCDTGNSYYKPQGSGSIQALSVCKRSGVVELMGRITVNGTVGGTVQQNSDMGEMIPAAYRPTTTTMIQCDQSQWTQLNGPAWYVRPDGHIIWGPYKQNATDATFHGIWTA